MRRMWPSVLAGVILLLTISLPAKGNTLTVGTYQALDAFPFFGHDGGYDGTRYQQIYAAASFSGPVDITAITLYPGGDSLTAGKWWSFYLSTTSKAVGGLDSVNFDANITSTNQFIGSVAGPISLAGQLTVAVAGGSFHYDPAIGNLLLDIPCSVPYWGGAYFEWGTATHGEFSRAHNFGGGNPDAGLVTTFDYTPAGPTTPVPEPASMLLLSTGVVGLAGRAWKKRRVRRAS